MTRTSTAISSVPPTRRITFSCNARSSLICIACDVSPISSRKIVPPSATSKKPFLFATAPVNEPLVCPNSSLSSSSSGRAPQLIETNGLPRRGLALCMAPASTSLPVPLSPVRSTVLEVGATWAMTSMICFIWCDRATSRSGP